VPSPGKEQQLDGPAVLAGALLDVVGIGEEVMVTVRDEDEPTAGEDDRDAAATAMDGERATTMRAPLFTVSNHHTAAGDAAGISYGYFANEYGEQAIYAYDHATGAATIRLGDAGWHDVHRVTDGEAEGLVLTHAEAGRGDRISSGTWPAGSRCGHRSPRTPADAPR
jgi:hypothetical protein